jgi:hypothetical protein
MDLDREVNTVAMEKKEEQPSDKKNGMEILQEILLSIGDVEVRS